MSSVSKSGKSAPASNVGLFGSMLQSGLYKAQQGRVVRQVTFVSIAIVALLIAWDVSQITFLEDMGKNVGGIVGGVLSALGLWFAYRIVNYPPFADFLIAVEAEMKKVSWPAWPELWKASLVVIFVIFSMALSLWLFDLLWTYLFQLIGIRGK